MSKNNSIVPEASLFKRLDAKSLEIKERDDDEIDITFISDEEEDNENEEEFIKDTSFRESPILYESDDEIFDESLYEEEDYNNVDSIDVENYRSINSDEMDLCIHTNSIMSNGVEVCTDCGTEIYKELSLEAEWRYYGDNDSKHNSDPSRCHLRKNDEKNIYNDVKDIDLPRNIIVEANDLYLLITEGKTRRGKFRKALIFACVFNAYKYQLNPQTPEELQEKFELTKKDISRGLCQFNLKMKKSRKPTYISPINFIPCIMKKKFNSSDEHVEKVKKLYKKIECKSILLNRSNPQSTISGLIYYYCRLIGKDITCAKFSEIVKLSDLTIGKISRNISEILGTADQVKLN